MKKVLVVLVVLATMSLGSMAFAADVNVSGSVDIRNRMFSNLDTNKYVQDNGADTQERVRLNVDAKTDAVKARVSIENDWDDWGRFEQPMADSNAVTNANSERSDANTKGALDLREAWMNFNLPGLPVNVTAGHQLLQLGQGWFFRSLKYGSDAWVLANVTGNNTAAFVDVKISEGTAYGANASDDVDAYVLLDSMKLSNNATAGIDITLANDRKNALGLASGTNATQAQNIGLNYAGQAGIVGLKAELDVQMGKASKANPNGSDAKFKGNQIVVQGTIPVNPVAIDFTVARGSGPKTNQSDYNQFVNFLDADQHYSFLYEYKVNGACGGLHQGFCNTTALGVGATMALSKSLDVGANLWALQSTEKVMNAAGDSTNALGQEIDLNANWKMYNNLSWNWQLGYLMPGKAYDKADGSKGDAATGVQGVLSYNF